MGIRFFKIVGVFSYAAAALALLAAIGLLIFASAQIFGGVDENIQQPKPKIEEYIQENTPLESSESYEPSPSTASTQDNEVSKEDKEYFSKVNKIYDNIINNITSYAETNEQPQIEREHIENYLIESTPNMDREQYLEFLEALSDESDKLLERSEKNSALEASDPKHVVWYEYFDWFLSEYKARLQEEHNRIEREKYQQSAARAQSLYVLGAAGTAFLVFVFFTMILLLVQIESNTRKSIIKNNS